MSTHCDFDFQNTESPSEIRTLVMHNGSIFRICRAHYDRMSSRNDAGKNGYETAARELFDRDYHHRVAPSSEHPWVFPQWSKLTVVERRIKS